MIMYFMLHFINLNSQEYYNNISLIINRMQDYKLLNKIGEGTFSDVFKALSLKDNKYVAIKCMKKTFQEIDMVKNLSQVKALHALSSHQNVVKLLKILYDEPTGKLALVFQLMDQNLFESIIQRKTNISHQVIKEYMHKTLKSIAFMHQKGFFHRDIKPENILVTGESIKLADFGTSKHIDTPLPLTQYIATRWYRPPQCLLTDGFYGKEMDMWGFACVLFEAITKYPLFNGKNQIDQISKINKIIGSPSAQLIEKFKPNASHMKQSDWNFPYQKGISFSRLLPNASGELVDFLEKVLVYDPKKRLTAQEALKHPYFNPSLMNSLIQTRQKSSITNLATSFKSPNHPHNNLHKKHHYQQKCEQQQTQNTFLPPISHLKFDLKPGVFNRTIANKFKNLQWQKFNNKH